MTIPALLPLAGLFPELSMHSEFFQILATFVALNSLIYATLAVLKVLPGGYSLSRSSGRNRRKDNRSIYPTVAPRRFVDGEAPTATDDRRHSSQVLATGRTADGASPRQVPAE